MMVKDQKSDITEAEAELYDRQIRLWGIDSQRQLRQARILLIGVQGFGAEIAKNLILAGVKKMHLLDSGIVSEEDSCAQFLVPRDSIGMNRAEASLQRAQALNPMVEVIADQQPVSSKDNAFFGNFDIVVATSLSMAELEDVNRQCRATGTKFFCGEVNGMFGYYFADLVISPNADKPLLTYSPISWKLTKTWIQSQTLKKIGKMDYSFLLMMVLMHFKQQYKRNPDRKQRENDIQNLLKIRDEVLSNLCITSSKIPDSVLSALFAELSPVCAIVGGLIAQDIIHAITSKENPAYNFFFFNPEKCLGFYEKVTA